MKRAYGFVFFGDGALGFFLPWETHLAESSNLLQVVSHPEGVRARVSGARPQAHAAIGGHAKAVAVLVLARVNMGFPRRGRAISRQLDGESGGTVGLNGDHKGRLDGKHRSAEGEHHGGRWPRYRRGQRLAIRLQACAARADRVGLVSAMLDNRRETGKGACAFQTS